MTRKQVDTAVQAAVATSLDRPVGGCAGLVRKNRTFVVAGAGSPTKAAIRGHGPDASVEEGLTFRRHALL